MRRPVLAVGGVILALALIISGCGQKGPGEKLDENDVAVPSPVGDENTISGSDVPDAVQQGSSTEPAATPALPQGVQGAANPPASSVQTLSDADIAAEEGGDSSLLGQEDVASQS